VAAWLCGNALVLINVVALCMPGPFSTVMGVRSRIAYTILVFNQSHQLKTTQPGHPSVGRHNEYWRWSMSPLGKKRRVLHNSGPVPGLLAYWYSLLKALVATGLLLVDVAQEEMPNFTSFRKPLIFTRNQHSNNALVRLHCANRPT